MPTNTNIVLNPDGTLPIRQIEEELYKLTEEYSLETYPAKHREHLGVSVIGEKCYRKLYYGFRWVKLEQHIGRMRRLFNRGHSEEEKIDKLLTWMGFFNRSIDPVTDKQYKFSRLNGHYGGSGDSISLLPWFRTDDGPRILVEKKTHKGKLFKALKDTYSKIKSENPDAVALKVSYPKHYSQMCGYGEAFKIRYGLYIAVNKDDDDIYFELVPLDWNHAIELENKAKDIITSKVLPDRISNDPSFYECQYCNFQHICHWGELVEKNCRSCKHATPIENAQWYCGRWNNVIPDDFIAKGCDEHLSVNE